jgi:hypothetical protein
VVECLLNICEALVWSPSTTKKKKKKKERLEGEKIFYSKMPLGNPQNILAGGGDWISITFLRHKCFKWIWVIKIKVLGKRICFCNLKSQETFSCTTQKPHNTKATFLHSKYTWSHLLSCHCEGSLHFTGKQRRIKERVSHSKEMRFGLNNFHTRMYSPSSLIIFLFVVYL